MKYVSKNRTHNKKVWATILVISMMLQFFLPFTGPLNAVPVRAEETSERMTSPASIEALDLSDEVISRPKTESPSVGDIVDAQPVQVGPFKNVKHKLSIADHQENSCRRVLKGELEFDWPEPSTYVDVVFVQDFSGSFKSIDPSIPDPIISIGNAVHEMLDGLSIGQDFNGYPKDRVMFVGFQGSQGTAEISNYYSYGDLIKTSTADASYKIRKSNLMNSRSQMNTWIKNHYYADIVKGGTPTVDGMGEAYDHYRSQVINTAGQPIHPYDRETYYVTDNEGNLLERKRKTIYVLITDGAANNAKWKYLSEGARKN